MLYTFKFPGYDHSNNRLFHEEYKIMKGPHSTVFSMLLLLFAAATELLNYLRVNDYMNETIT